MQEVAWAAFFLVILIGCSLAGWASQRLLKEHHKSSATTDSARTIVGMVVTFSALVLGLLVTSVKSDFDDHTGVYRRYGIALFEFDRRLQEYGPDTDAIRKTLRAYTASVIADTWPDEPAPAGDYPRDVHPVTPGSDETAEFTTMMTQMDRATLKLAATDALHLRLADLLREEVRAIEGIRWSLIERSDSRLSPILMAVLMFWLAIVFLVFGMVSPRNRLTLFVLILSALSVASSLYLILDLNTTTGGFITVPSRPLRDALWHMDQGGGA
ncbi:bestrophin-like domain [Lichenifustis flavocetrariae]|uniref:DUF4239 domain-containing protein n=1 Tax=Lichenifustis flavocetrariae TaxID=2949735 RepID=A0AA41Z0I6_9HYPH|nr:hypothetical protein [Lichenifustis flavocetrariae]MCW6511969.1 hypothetical protein [Lichenifustis flavocetrariae]